MASARLVEPRRQLLLLQSCDSFVVPCLAVEIRSFSQTEVRQRTNSAEEAPQQQKLEKQPPQQEREKQSPSEKKKQI